MSKVVAGLMAVLLVLCGCTQKPSPNSTPATTTTTTSKPPRPLTLKEKELQRAGFEKIDEREDLKEATWSLDRISYVVNFRGQVVAVDVTFDAKDAPADGKSPHLNCTNLLKDLKDNPFSRNHVELARQLSERSRGSLLGVVFKTNLPNNPVIRGCESY